jgi:putative flavoprotein involved in K+ transport
LKFFEARQQDIPDPAMLNLKPPQITGVGSNRTISLQMLAKKGAVIVGKAENANDKTIALQPDAAQNVQFADHFSQMIKGMIDEYIEQNSLNAPAPLPDEADLPDMNADCVTNISSLDLAEHNINSIIWATGFNCDFSYIKLPVTGADGIPLHDNGSATVEGLYFIGLPWLRKRKSSLIYGAKDDAEFIAEQVYKHALSMHTT